MGDSENDFTSDSFLKRTTKAQSHASKPKQKKKERKVAPKKPKKSVPSFSIENPYCDDKKIEIKSCEANRKKKSKAVSFKKKSKSFDEKIKPYNLNRVEQNFSLNADQEIIDDEYLDEDYKQPSDSDSSTSSEIAPMKLSPAASVRLTPPPSDSLPFSCSSQSTVSSSGNRRSSRLPDERYSDGGRRRGGSRKRCVTPEGQEASPDPGYSDGGSSRGGSAKRSPTPEGQETITCMGRNPDQEESMRASLASSRLGGIKRRQGDDRDMDSRIKDMSNERSPERERDSTLIEQGSGGAEGLTGLEEAGGWQRGGHLYELWKGGARLGDKEAAGQGEGEGGARQELVDTEQNNVVVTVEGPGVILLQRVVMSSGLEEQFAVELNSEMLELIRGYLDQTTQPENALVIEMNDIVKVLEVAPPEKHAFPCSMPRCKRKLTTQNRLDRHLKAHSKEPDRSCDICNKVFKTEQRLARHKSTVHEEKKLLKCTHCNISKSSKNYLKKHIEKFHSQKQCPKCDKLFESKFVWQKHNKSCGRKTKISRK